MGVFDVSDRKAILSAIKVADDLGQAAFLDRYGFGKATRFQLVHGGKLYDSKAIVAVAHGLQFPDLGVLEHDEFSGGAATVLKVLRRLGFEVRDRNPPWSRDELILALDLYMANPAAPPSKTSGEVMELSSVLNRLAAALGVGAGERFRNANGVYMKMMNFRRLDPAFIGAGKKGLSRGNKDEETVWAEFASDRERLTATAASIRAAVDAGDVALSAIGDDDGIEEAPEGAVLTRLHRIRERSRVLVQSLKARRFAEAGRLACEVCDFDFAYHYGSRGQGFIEAHHTRPLHTLEPGGKTKLKDLALVCANCHRMIHARRPWLSIQELREMLQL